MPKVSIITPFFNNESPYFRKCLDSLVNQTLRDIEIILVDDCSTDASLEIAREYERHDPRVRVIAMTENCGAASARNAALAIAAGEFLGFVDSDDYVDLDFFEKLYNAAIESGADIVKSAIVINDQKKIYLHKWIEENKYIFYAQWQAAIYSHKIVMENNISFPADIPTGQDLIFQLKCVYYANRVKTIDDAHYYWVRRPDSLDSEFSPRYKTISQLKVREMFVDFINSNKMPRKDYMHIFNRVFHDIKWIFNKTTSADAHKIICAEYIKIYAKCKYKSDFAREHHALYPYLACEDLDGFYKACKRMGLVANNEFNFKLFGKISLWRVKRAAGAVNIYVLYVPLFRTRDNWLYVFKFIPLFKFIRR